MEKQRKKISEIDSAILKLIAERRELSRKIIGLKNKKRSSIRDKSREKELLTQLVELGRKEGLDSYLVTKVFHEIIDALYEFSQRFSGQSYLLIKDAYEKKLAELNKLTELELID